MRPHCVVISLSNLHPQGPMCTHSTAFCIEMCCAVSEHMRSIVGNHTEAISGAWLQSWGWCAFQSISSGLQTSLQTILPCDAFNERSRLWCATLSSPYSFYAGEPPPAQNQEASPPQCRLGYVTYLYKKHNAVRGVCCAGIMQLGF